MLIISGEPEVAGALSGLPFIYHVATAEERAGRKVYLVLRNAEVLSLIPRSELDKLIVLENLKDLWSMQPVLARHRVMHLDVGLCYTRYGSRYHMMYAHFANHGVYLDKWEPPQLEVPAKRASRAYDFIISPYSRPGSFCNGTWDYGRWQELIDKLVPRFSVCVVTPDGGGCAFDHVESCKDRPLRDLCATLKSARRAVLSIDNDVSHLAHSLRVPHFLIYPAGLAPTWSNNENANAYRIIAAPSELSVGQVWRGMEPFLKMSRDDEGSGTVVADA